MRSEKYEFHVQRFFRLEGRRNKLSDQNHMGCKHIVTIKKMFGSDTICLAMHGTKKVP